MVEELEGREADWKNTQMAARNKLLLKKWKEKIKVVKSMQSFMTSRLEIKSCWVGLTLMVWLY